MIPSIPAGSSSSSSAASRNTGLFGGVNIGGLNPPVFGGGSNQVLVIGIVAAAVVLWLLVARK